MPLTNNAGDLTLNDVPPAFRVLPVIVDGKHGTFCLFYLRIRSLQTVEETIAQTRQLFESAEYRASSAVPHGHLSNPFMKESIYKATISSVGVPNEDLEAAILPRNVTITAKEYSPELTAFFWRPARSKDCGPFADRYPDILIDAAQTRYILIHHEMSKTAVVIAAAILVASWLLLSALIGIVRKNMEAGFTVAGVGIGVMALFVAVLKGIQK
ncbi:hypothetical protein CkaCkLH20_05164 [Colletotrichum karsti]|uniref:Uncharacterized protein n=1 Tax=Colletotrichum karsti TaxID=1095194 RepID=A0A9P6I7M1_9PEZI|nr:uncharacterized protein CkaCkLH20_05164 [Colletotrichum karsti]KAF9877464.1 hypothetical protein CkaCkLH20_05164 [Colletotrichum karsti]